MQHRCATPTYKKQQQQRLRYTRSSMHPLPCFPLRVRSAHCFSEAAKLLIKAFAFYIWRTRAHTHTHTHERTNSAHRHTSIYIVHTYLYRIWAPATCAGVLATIAPQVMQQKCELLLFLRVPCDALRIPHIAVKRFQHNHAYTPPLISSSSR